MRDITELLDALIEIAPLARVDGRQYGDKLRDDRKAIEDCFASQEKEIEALKGMYKEVCDPLQECCQRHKLGLGGEMCHELVIEEVDRLRALERETVRPGGTPTRIYDGGDFTEWPGGVEDEGDPPIEREGSVE